MADRIYYCFCDSNCKFETMTKEQIFAAIAEATGNTPTEIDDAFITKLKEQNKGGTVTIWRGTVAEYNALVALGELDEDCIYIKTDEKPLEEVNAKIAAIEKNIEETNETVNSHGTRIQATAELLGFTMDKLAEQTEKVDEIIEEVNNMWYGDAAVMYDGVTQLDGDTEIEIGNTTFGPVSNQCYGIMLAFVPYVGGVAKDLSVNWVFVPKYHIAAFGGKSITVMLNRYDFKSTGFKSLYISDDTIKGFASNVESGTADSGIKYDNAAWALRYVIGV